MDQKPPRKRRRWRRILIVLVLLSVPLWIGRAWLMRPQVPEGSYLLLDLEGQYPEEPPDDLVRRVFRERPMSFLDVLTVIRDAREDRRVAGMVVRVRPLAIGWAKAQDIREALLAFRATGKPLIAYLEQEFTASTLEYYVASAASTVHLPRSAAVPLNGLLAQYFFLGGVWEKLDIDMEVEKIREYKTAGDMLANKQMSPYQREMENSLLDSIFAQLVEGIASARGRDPALVHAAIDAAPATAEELTARGLADGPKFLDELRRDLVGARGSFLPAADYRKSGGPPLEAPLRHQVAVVFGAGMITTGESAGGPWGRSANMGSDTIADAFRQAADDDGVKAIVFRVDSPGGSALASDLIWRAVQRARAAKPVIVSMSDVAGSGGYYVAAGASKIVAQPGTLTGSIGVVVSKPNVAGFLAKLGINTDSLARGELAELASVTKSMNAEERARLTSVMTHVYNLFVERVAQGRKLSPERVNEIGRGRVWTGAQAQANGLVDELGGFFAAINAAKAAAGIAVTEKVALVFYPKRKALLERIMDALNNRVIGPRPSWWQHLRSSLAAYEFPPGSVLTLMPQQIVIR